jgi:hypothetical protein
MLIFDLTMEDIQKHNNTYVRLIFNNGNTPREGTIRTLHSTLIQLEERFNDKLIPCQYDIRDIVRIEI